VPGYDENGQLVLTGIREFQVGAGKNTFERKLSGDFDYIAVFGAGESRRVKLIATVDTLSVPWKAVVHYDDGTTSSAREGTLECKLHKNVKA